jgi:hypothetical protein
MGSLLGGLPASMWARRISIVRLQRDNDLTLHEPPGQVDGNPPPAGVLRYRRGDRWEWQGAWNDRLSSLPKRGVGPGDRGADVKSGDQPYTPDWERGLEFARGARRCGARCRSGLPCRGPAMRNGRCRMHGGASPGAPSGERNGRYRHGRYTIARRTMMAETPGLRRALMVSLRAFLVPSQ